MKGETHDLNHDLTFSAHTIHCVRHSIRSMFRVLCIYNFATNQDLIILILQNVNVQIAAVCRVFEKSGGFK